MKKTSKFQIYRRNWKLVSNERYDTQDSQNTTQK